MKNDSRKILVVLGVFALIVILVAVILVFGKGLAASFLGPILPLAIYNGSYISTSYATSCQSNCSPTSGLGLTPIVSVPAGVSVADYLQYYVYFNYSGYYNNCTCLGLS